MTEKFRRSVALSLPLQTYYGSEAKRLGIPTAELIRQALAWYMETHPVSAGNKLKGRSK